MHVSALLWLCCNIDENDIAGKDIIEVGSQDVNGSIRDYILKFKPRSYLGVDITPGKGVDLVVDAEGLIQKFGEETFDVVISTEMIEHVNDWKNVIHNLKGILKKSGLLIITTRSKGFGYHAYPYDFWRYEIEDFKSIFKDFTILKLDKDHVEEPGVFLKAKKPLNFQETNLESIALYSMLTERRETVTPKRMLIRVKFKLLVKKFLMEIIPSIYRHL